MNQHPLGSGTAAWSPHALEPAAPPMPPHGWPGQPVSAAEPNDPYGGDQWAPPAPLPLLTHSPAEDAAPPARSHSHAATPPALPQRAPAAPARRAQRRGLGADPAVGDYRPTIALRGISGHLTRTDNGVMAWYRLLPRPWSMRPDHDREGLMIATGLGWTQLTGRWLHLRVMWRPFPAAEWARRHDDWARPMPDQAGGIDWITWLVSSQRSAMAHPHAIKEVFVGVEVHAGRRLSGRLADRMAGRGPRRWRELLERVADGELAALDEEVTHLDRVMGAGALAGTPATASEMVSLLYRSCGLGLPASATSPTAPHEVWETPDLAGPAEFARWAAAPYAPTLQVTGIAPDGQPLTRHVAIASLGRMADELDVPAVDLPWMTVPDMMGIGIEWSARLRILESERASRQLRMVADRVDAQHRHYELEHGLAAPRVLARQIDLASRVRDELETDQGGLSARCEGWWRVAISADTDAEALNALEQVRVAYAPGIALEHPEAQYKIAREFIPGEPLATTAYRRRMSVRHLSMAMPQITDIIGDDHGPIMFTTMSGRPVAWDPWGDIDTRQVSGLTPVIGTLGAGKTFLIGNLGYQALRTAQAYVTFLDPSGLLTRLADLPELAGHARAVSLLDAEPGTLNPFRIVPVPRREDYPPGPAGDREHLQDVAAADAQRTTLVISVMIGLLPASIRRDGDTQTLLLDAIGQVGPDPGHDPRTVIDTLKKMGRDGARLAGAFEPILNTSGPARLLLGHPDADEWDAHTDRLLVISAGGLTLPREGTDQADWNLDEQLSLALMHLAAWLTYRRTYQLPRSAPKIVGLDELRALSLLPSGRSLIQRFARDNRKFRVRVLIAGQLASDVLRLGGDTGDSESGLAGLAHDVIVGRTTGETAQAEALQLLRVPTGVGYEAQLGQLSNPPLHTGGDHHAADAPREFIWRSGDLCELVRLDASGPHLAGLRAALDTNAARADDEPPRGSWG